jgi:hypothetical protein
MPLASLKGRLATPKINCVPPEIVSTSTVSSLNIEQGPQFVAQMQRSHRRLRHATVLSL